MSELKIGKENIIKAKVDENMLAVNVGSGSLEVFATPTAAALMEKAAYELIQPYLEDGITTVGTKISIEHTSATPIGAVVKAKAILTEIDGRKYSFEISAEDNAGIIAKGIHERFAVKSERFMEKTKMKLT